MFPGKASCSKSPRSATAASTMTRLATRSADGGRGTNSSVFSGCGSASLGASAGSRAFGSLLPDASIKIRPPASRKLEGVKITPSRCLQTAKTSWQRGSLLWISRSALGSASENRHWLMARMINGLMATSGKSPEIIAHAEYLLGPIGSIVVFSVMAEHQLLGSPEAGRYGDRRFAPVVVGTHDFDPLSQLAQ